MTPGPTVPDEYLLPGVAVEEVVEAVPAAARRGAMEQAADISVEAPAGESAVIAVRHESGAITFHAAVTRESKPKGAASLAERRCIFMCRCELRRVLAGAF